MKYVRKIAVVILSLLIAVSALIVAPMAMAEVGFQENDWVMLQPGEVVYKDAGLKKKIAETSNYVLVKLAAVQGDVAAVRSGGKTAFISLQYASHLREGDALVTNCNTKIYEELSTKSKSEAIKKNKKVEFVSISGDSVKVRHNGMEGYMNIKHLNFVSDSRRFTVAIPTGLD